MMARVIKQGRCAYRFIEKQPACSQDGRDQEEGSFNTLFCMLPSEQGSGSFGTEDAGIDEGVKQSEKEEADRSALLEAVGREAEALKAEAEEVLAAAKARAAEIESRAYSQGYEQGQKDGEELGRRQFSVGLQHLESILENLKNESMALAPKYEAQMLQTCLLVAGKLIEREIDCDRELISRLLTTSLQKAVEGSSVIVHVNPRDREHLEERFLERLSSPGGNTIEVRANASIKRGGCLIETEFGLIDASLESRWKAILETVGETLKERTGIDLDEQIKKIIS